MELVHLEDHVRNQAYGHAEAAPLLKDVDPETAHAGDPISQVNIALLLEPLLVLIRHQKESHLRHLFGGNARESRHGVQMAVDPQMGVIADLQVQVGGLVRGSNAQQLVKIHKTSWGSSLLFIGSELILLEA